MIYIAFKSEDEMLDAMAATQEKYIEMITKTNFDGQSILNMNHALLGENYNLMARNWYSLGYNFLQILTKQKDNELCELLADNVHLSFNACFKTYVITREKTTPWSDQDVAVLKNILKDIVMEFIDNTDLMFRAKYFTYCGEMEDADENDIYYTPNHVAKKQPFKLAMAMALHSRLGALSGLRCLSADIFRMIWECDSLLEYTIDF